MSALIERYPEFLQRSPEFRAIQEALEPERPAIRQAMDGLMAQLCADTATWGLRYWEETLGIPVETEKDIGFRRSRVRSKLRGVGVTTGALIREVAESFSNGEVEVRELPAQYRIEIKFVGTIGTPPNMEDLTEALREIIPAHLGWDYVFILNPHQTLGQFPHRRLAAYTHWQLRNDALVFTAHAELGQYEHEALADWTQDEMRNEVMKNAGSDTELSIG